MIWGFLYKEFFDNCFKRRSFHMKDFFIYSANMYLMPPVQWHWGINTQPYLSGVYREDDEVKKKKK